MSLPDPADNAILTAWDETLARRGGAAAIVSEQGEPLRSFRDIEGEAAEWSGRLALAPAAVVALQLGNRPEWPALILACFRKGIVPLPLGRHLETAERALALATCGASAVVEMGADGLRFTPVAAALALTLTDWPSPPPHFLKLTSGTTAAPRAIRFQAEQLLADCLQICETMGIGEADLNYGVIPLSHSYGFSNLLTPLLCRGVPLVVSEDRMPRAILNGLARTGATVFPGMPVFYDKFAAMENTPALPRLRLCISAGAPLTAPVAQRFTARFGLKVHTFYGSSECGGIAYDGAETADYEEGFVGTPMARVRIEPQPGGTIRVESAAVGDGYWPWPGDGDHALGPGRFTPGDLVRPEARGLFLAGRTSDAINVAGRKLNPREVEAQLLRFPGVREAVVFGIPSPIRHEEAVACVVGDVAARELLDFARSAESTLSGWQVPKAIWLVPEIPVSERGKINRRELAKRYAEAEKSEALPASAIPRP